MAKLGAMLQDTKPLKFLGELFGSYWISLSRGEQNKTFYFGKAQIFKSAVMVKRTLLFLRRMKQDSILIRILNKITQTSFLW